MPSPISTRNKAVLLFHIHNPCHHRNPILEPCGKNNNALQHFHLKVHESVPKYNPSLDPQNRNESGSRGSINQEILNAFNAEVGENENVEIIARLPISTYWTTEVYL